MKNTLLGYLTGMVLVTAFVFSAPAQLWAGSPAEIAKLEKRLMKAAPKAVVNNATLIAIGKDGKKQVLRKGTNNFSCLPLPSGDICADQATMTFLNAYLMKKEPDKGMIGLSYMLGGDSGASMTDPNAKEKTPDNHWVIGGSHMMLVGTTLEGYPEGGSADPNQPYVMWPGTPWAHLMIPIK